MDVDVPVSRLGGVAGLNSFGPGTLALLAPNSYSGTTSLNAGTLALGASPAISGSTLALTAGTLESTASVNSSQALVLNNSNVTFAVGGNAPITFAGNAAMLGQVQFTDNLPAGVYFTGNWEPMGELMARPARWSSTARA